MLGIIFSMTGRAVHKECYDTTSDARLNSLLPRTASRAAYLTNGSWRAGDPKMPESSRMQGDDDRSKAMIEGTTEGSITMKVLRAAAIMTLLLAGPAYAAAPGAPPAPTDPPKSQAEIEREKSTDNAYKRSLRNIPDQPPADPWGGAREAPRSVSTPPKRN